MHGYPDTIKIQTPEFSIVLIPVILGVFPLQKSAQGFEKRSSFHRNSYTSCFIQSNVVCFSITKSDFIVVALAQLLTNYAVQEGMSLRRAAMEFGVPITTLQDRLTGKVQFGAIGGGKRNLSNQEVEKLVSFLIHCGIVLDTLEVSSKSLQSYKMLLIRKR